MKRIVILYGGKSGEHDVSLASAASIVRHLDTELFEPILVGIDNEGSWMLQDSGAAADARASGDSLSVRAGPRVLAAPGAGLLVERPRSLKALACDLVFPVLHGTFGEDGTIQGLLEVADLPYVGAPVMGSAIGMDKEKAKELWLRAGLPVVPFVVARARDLGPGDPSKPGPAMEALARKVAARLGWPCFVKPARGGSSVGAGKVASAEGLLPALRLAFEWDDKVMIEPFIDGREMECSVLGNEEPRAFPPCEIQTSHEFYDYEAKYIDPQGARFEIPARLDREQEEKLRSIAVSAFEACEMSGMARVDFFVDRRTGEILLNEINSIPGFTNISMYPRMCEVGGLAYTKLITRLAELALERHEARKRLRFDRVRPRSPA